MEYIHFALFQLTYCGGWAGKQQKSEDEVEETGLEYLQVCCVNWQVQVEVYSISNSLECLVSHWGSKADRKYCTRGQSLSSSFFFFNQTGTLSPERGLYIHKGKLFRNKIPLSQKLPTHVLKKKSTFFWFANIIKVPAYTKRKRLSRTFLSSAAFGLISATNTNFMPSFPCFCWQSQAAASCYRKGQTERRSEATHGRQTLTGDQI